MNWVKTSDQEFEKTSDKRNQFFGGKIPKKPKTRWWFQTFFLKCSLRKLGKMNPF